ncbi:MAG: PRD domain-containing protein, partial [Coprobacillus sp.]
MVIELDSQFDKRKHIIEKIVKDFIQKNHIEISQTSIDNLVIHLSLCVARELNGTYIPTSESQIDHLKEHEYYSKATEIIMALNKEFDIEIDKNQTSYTTMYLANINLLDIDFNCNFD